MAIDYGNSAKKQLEAGLGVDPVDMPDSVKKGIDAFAEIVRARTDVAPDAAESFKILNEAIASYNAGPTRESYQNLVDQNVADKAQIAYDADTTMTLSSAELGVPTPGGRLKLREKLTNTHVSKFLTGSNDLATFRTGTLDPEMSTQRIDGNIYTQVEESIKREIDNRLSSLEGKSPSEILATYNTTSNPELKSKIGSTYAEQISKARVLNENSRFLQANQNMATYEAGLQNAISTNNMTVEQAATARQELYAEMDRAAQSVIEQITKGSMSLADAQAYSATIQNPELRARVTNAIDALDTTGMEPGGTNAATAVANIIASPDFNGLGTGLQAVIQAEATASLAMTDNLRQMATNQGYLAEMARNIQTAPEYLEGNARFDYLLRKIGPVLLIVALSFLGVGLLPAGTLAAFPINTLILSAGGVGSLYRYFGQGGIRPYLNQRLKEASDNLDIAEKYTVSANKHTHDAATADRETVQKMMKANAGYRARRLPNSAQSDVVQYLTNQLGGDVAVN